MVRHDHFLAVPPAAMIDDLTKRQLIILNWVVFVKDGLGGAFLLRNALLPVNAHHVVVLLDEVPRRVDLPSVRQLDVLDLDLVREELVFHPVEDNASRLLDSHIRESHNFKWIHDDLVVDRAVLEIVLLPNVEPHEVVSVIVFLRLVLLIDLYV